VATHVGRGLFLGCQSRPIPRVRGPSAPQFFSAYTYTLYRRTTKFDVVTHVVEGHLFWCQPRLHPKRAEFQGSSIFGFSSIYALHPLTQNDQTRHGVTYGEGRVLGGQLHRCICTKRRTVLSATADFLVFQSLHSYLSLLQFILV